MSDSALCDLHLVHEDAVHSAMKGRASDDDLTHLADVFGMLANPGRLRIVEALSRQELCVCDLSAVTGLSQSAVSHHLRHLRQLRLVAFRKEGRMAYYRLDDAHVAQLLHTGLEHIRE
ncbi:MAG: metalloregulator ArsR/SmtB family transcription factor [Gemmatimonadota bacterium]|nr:metalloregulator ArsR/SmtB family transcription factor [Gemmatimonadota bacterium]MDH5760627.1 metalloregulator ArsR/SmtB family transcription factor [Gemmatimonadota bacterium]